MRLNKAPLLLLMLAVCAGLQAQIPIGLGPDATAGHGPGYVKYFNWFTATPTGGCTNGSNGFCVGANPNGDTYYFSAHLINASQLPVTSGLPIVGTINDYNFGSLWAGNIGVLQLDTWSWAAPTAAHMTMINAMQDYGTAGASHNEPVGWFGALTSGDGQTTGTWKNRIPFASGGNLFLPVERQISPGDPSVHDATFLISPDSGNHWCNPYTYWHHSGSPGCDSSNWDSTGNHGDAPRCDASTDSTHLCTNTAYLDSTHSSILFKALPYGTDNWNYINYQFQDCADPTTGCSGNVPTGVSDGCDPTAYVCFFTQLGWVARVPLPATNLMNRSQWQFYTCPAITPSYRCPGSSSSSWTSTLANATSTFYPNWYLGPFQTQKTIILDIGYFKEFHAYLGMGDSLTSPNTLDFYWAPTAQGPLTLIARTSPDPSFPNATGFIVPSPALGKNVISTSPPHIQFTTSTNSYEGGSGSPHFYMIDLVQGRNLQGEAFQADYARTYVSGSGYSFGNNQMGAGYQFSSGNITGSFPRSGLVWSFDLLDMGINQSWTNWPYFMDRANYSAVLTACDVSYASPSYCGSMTPGHGTGMNVYGIVTNQNASQYGGHFRTAQWEGNLGAPVNAPAAMQGNGSYTVIGVYRQEAATEFGRPGGIWSTGVRSSSDNTMIEFNQVNGTLELDWGATDKPHYRYITNFTFPNFTNWYFAEVTVQAATGGNCATASVWVGGATTPGILKDVNAGATCNAVNSPGSKTPNVSAAPFVLGFNVWGNSFSSQGEPFIGTTATTMVYSRALSYMEIQQAYHSMVSAMARRGITLQ
jgi:hypothetical protein